jgi:hypothetical protein
MGEMISALSREMELRKDYLKSENPSPALTDNLFWRRNSFTFKCRTIEKCI